MEHCTEEELITAIKKITATAYDEEESWLVFNYVMLALKYAEHKMRKKPRMDSPEYIDYVTKVEEPEKHG